MNRRFGTMALLAAIGTWQGGQQLFAQTATPQAATPQTLTPPSATPTEIAPSDPTLAAVELVSDPFESESAGISVKYPVTCRRVASTGAGDDIAQFADPIRKWELKLQRIVHQEPIGIVATVDNNGKPVPGMLDKVARDLRLNMAGFVVRQDVSNIADPGAGADKQSNNVGMIAVRYTSGGARYLLQQALVRSTERSYFSMVLITPIGDGKLDAETATPPEVVAVKTFGRMLDSVRLLDTAAIRQEQDSRLRRTMVLLTQLHSHSRLEAAILPQQWLRVIRDGRDVGYSYVTEQNADGPLKPGKNVQNKGDGLLVGVRARSILTAANNQGAAAGNPPKPMQIDVASWWFLSAEQNQEEWSRVTVTTDLGPDGKAVLPLRQQQYTEFGSTGVESHIQLDRKSLPGTKIDPNQPPVVKVQQRQLDGTIIDPTGASKPFTQPLPTQCYLPQALASMLPRLMPLHPDVDNEPRTYMFVTYVPETRQVMCRYVEVKDAGDFELAGEKVHAIPITDRLGWHGSVTTHYVSPAGVYLGSENQDTHTVTRVATADELLKIWKNADLKQPGAIERPKAGAAAAIDQRDRSSPPRVRSDESANVQGPPSPIH